MKIFPYQKVVQVVLEKNDINSLFPVLSSTEYSGNYSADNDKRTLKAGKKVSWLEILGLEEQQRGEFPGFKSNLPSTPDWALERPATTKHYRQRKNTTTIQKSLFSLAKRLGKRRLSSPLSTQQGSCSINLQKSKESQANPICTLYSGHWPGSPIC